MPAAVERIRVRRLSGSLGAEILGANLCDLDAESFGVIQRALLAHQVVFFRASGLDDERQMALAARFGEPSVFPMMKLLGSNEPTFQVIEDGPESPPVADSWHTDVTWVACPPKCALLRATVVPERGGDTLWASTAAAYDALSPVMQSLLAGLEIRHDNEAFIEAVVRKMGREAAEQQRLPERLREAYPAVTHPLIRTHPETGRRAIYYGGTFMREVVGMEAPESRAVLQFLAQHVARPEFQCRWRWSPDDLVIWDERVTIHRAVADHFPQRRTVRRCVVEGDRPYFDADAVLAAGFDSAAA